jgi:hypothetical protein
VNKCEAEVIRTTKLPQLPIKLISTQLLILYVNIISVNLLDSDWIKTMPIKHSLAQCAELSLIGSNASPPTLNTKCQNLNKQLEHLYFGLLFWNELFKLSMFKYKKRNKDYSQFFIGMNWKLMSEITLNNVKSAYCCARLNKLTQWLFLVIDCSSKIDYWMILTWGNYTCPRSINEKPHLCFAR